MPLRLFRLKRTPDVHPEPPASGTPAQAAHAGTPAATRKKRAPKPKAAGKAKPKAKAAKKKR